MAGLVFGIDGGGSTARIRVADATNETLWEGRGAGANPNASSAELAARLASELYAEARAALGGPARAFSAGCLGLAGMGRAPERAEIEERFRALTGFAGSLVLVNDAEIALVGGLKSLEGMLLLSGTGSIALARAADGRTMRAGGMGHFLGDEGSAFFIGFEALRRCLRAEEGRDLETAMTPALLARFGLANPSEAVPFIYRNLDKARVAGAAALVEEFRARGDPLAASIFEEAKDELVLLASSLYKRSADLRDGEGELVLWGGLIENDRWLRNEVVKGIAGRHPALAVVGARASAAYGACMLALGAG